MSITPSNTRLQQELLRLYGSHDTALAPPARAAVLELARPADWSALGAVWRGVQGDLGLPAPAIAVTGSDGFQLWFALAEDSLAAEALQLLQALCRAYLGDLSGVFTDWTPLQDRGRLYAEHLDQDDPWQFGNFRTG